MDIIEYAMRMESDGEQYYRQMAAKTTQAGLKTILLMLADEEVKHFQILKKSRSQDASLTESGLLSEVRNIFTEMREGGRGPDPEAGQAGMYQHALEIERKSASFYRDKADETEQGYQRQLFLILAAEEDKHAYLIENILDYISRPAAWLENAEFGHLDEY